MTHIFFNENHEELLDNRSFIGIQPGDIILFSAVGHNRKARIHDTVIMLMQSIFGWQYHPKKKHANAGITHAAICVATNRGGPRIAEINRNGHVNHIQLVDAFYHTPKIPFAFRPLHVFRTNNREFGTTLADVAESAHPDYSCWSLKRAAGSLFTRPKKTNSQGVGRQDEKLFKVNTQCADFVVRSMKNAARQASRLEGEAGLEAGNYFPDVHTNLTPSSLLSYLLDKVDEGRYEHSIYVDIDPFQGIQRAIEEQIIRLEGKADCITARGKALALRDAVERVLHDMAEDAGASSIAKAETLFNAVKDILEAKRTNYNIFRRATSFVAVKKYLEKAQAYTRNLRY